MNDNLQEIFLYEIRQLLLPLAAATKSDVRGRLLFEVTGWNLEAGSDLAPEDGLAEFIDAYERLDGLIENPPETLADVLEALDRVNQLFSAVRQVQAQPGEEVQGLEELGKDLIKALVVGYLKSWHPAVHDVLALLTVIRPPADVSLERIPDLLADPLEVLSAEYLNPQGLVTAEHAKATADKLFPRLAALLVNIGVHAVYGLKPENGLDLGEVGNNIGAEMLAVFLQPDFGQENRFGVTLALSSRDLGDPGLVVIPFGEVLPDWDVDMDLTATATGYAFGPQGFTVLGASDATSVILNLMLFNRPAFRLGSMAGTRLEIGKFQISGDINLNTSDQEYGLILDMGSSALVISAGDGDGFLQKILPANGIRADFDLAIGWSNTKGVYFRGSAGLDAQLSVNKSLFGFLTLNSIHILIKTDGSDIQSSVAASISAQLGPVHALADGVGLKTIFSFPEAGGNLGLIDLALAFKSPTSIGLSIDAEGITGGGFLEVDSPNYAGMMQLSFRNEIELTAFGLITTKLPDGKDGFSLIIQIMAEFQPIQIGLGFALTGVGGLIGINRQINEEGLKEAFKNHTLDAFLFPENPIRDAVKIIESIQTIMPSRKGYHILGPMVQMFWGGSVRLVEFEVGIFIQTGGPLKVVIIGQARTHLPEGDFPRLVINMDVLGIIDFGEERVAIDAVLFDSRILNFTLDGKMALRSDWSSGEEGFALSVGGFHPQFQNIPPGFPPLTRLMVAIGSGNPRLTLQMYLAITPNTLQVGAKLDLWAKKSGFTVTGGTSFDALFTFSPFSFLVIVKIWVNIKRGFVDLGADLELELSGPNPIIAVGYAKFKVGWFSKKVRFRKQFGDKKPEPLPVVSPVAILLAELEHARSIRFELPTWASASLVFTQAAESKIDPVADILITQDAVPLNFSMQRFGGGRPPEAEQKLSITAGFESDKEKATKTLFAPEQFKNWSVDERLAAKPFEKYDAGIRFSGEYIIPENAVAERRVAFETVLRESQAYRQKQPKGNFKRAKVRTTCVWQPSVVEAQSLVNWSLFGSSSYFKPLRKVRDKHQANYIKVIEPRFILTGNETREGKFSAAALENQNNAAMSYAEAIEARKRATDTNIIIRSTADVISK